MHGCACKNQAVYTTAPQTLHQHTRLFWTYNPNHQDDAEREWRTTGGHYEDAPPFGLLRCGQKWGWRTQEEADSETLPNGKSRRPWMKDWRGLDPFNKDAIEGRCSLPLPLGPCLVHDSDEAPVSDVSHEEGLANMKWIRTTVMKSIMQSARVSCALQTSQQPGLVVTADLHTRLSLFKIQASTHTQMLD